MYEKAVSNDPGRKEAGTPLDVFDALHREYAFTVDVCACALNAKLPDYLALEDDSLSLLWDGVRAWCNPPYREIDPWLEKPFDPPALRDLLEKSAERQKAGGRVTAHDVASAMVSEFAAFLLPARTFNRWWARFKPLAERHYFVGRMKFVPPAGTKYTAILL